jgi:ABC-type transport system involved in multi-copper enzyme maturation permease subunit
MTTTIAPYRSAQQPGRDGFAQLLRAELTKLRTVRGWIIVLCAAALITAIAPIDLAVAAKNNNSTPVVATGPGGIGVLDQYYFVHRPLAGDGSITVRVSSLAGSGPLATSPPGYAPIPRTQPWAKAGLILTPSLRPGSAYAAVMATGGHGVRMQYNYTHDTPGPAGVVSASSPRWLRLTRSGDTITGYASADGTHWTQVQTVRLAGLPGTVQAGMFVTSPDYSSANQTFGGNNNGVDVTTQATARFGDVRLNGRWAGRAWAGAPIGQGEGSDGAVSGSGHHGRGRYHVKPESSPRVGVQQSDGFFTVTGSGDIAPFEPVTDPLQVAFYGTLLGLIALIALGAVFITAEYRRKMIRTTLTASPRRGRVLAAKAIVIGGASFAAGLIGTAIAFGFAARELRRNGWAPPVYRVFTLFDGTGVRVVLGTAALIGVVAVLAMAAGALMRRSAGAITAVIVTVVFPLILAVVLPLGPANWLLRVTPAAAFALQQTNPRYPQVSSSCLPYNGCFPLAPWAGFGVLCAWALVALGLAVYLMRRRDA